MDQGFINFTQDTENKLWLKAALTGFPGTGKSYTACTIAEMMGYKNKFCVLNTERKRVLLYAKEFGYQIFNMNPPFSPENYINAINQIISAGYEFIIIDSLSHEWMGKGGASNIVKNMASKDSMQNWHEYKTGRHQDLIKAITEAPAHIVCTLRSKIAYDLTEGENGKKKREAVGVGVQQEAYVEYEFDFVFEMQPDHSFICTKDSTGRNKLFEPGYVYVMDQITVDKINKFIDDRNSPTEPKLETVDVRPQLQIPELVEEKPTSINDLAAISEEAPKEPATLEEKVDILFNALDNIDSVALLEEADKFYKSFREELNEESQAYFDQGLHQLQLNLEPSFE